jgi:hypothetical protein
VIYFGFTGIKPCMKISTDALPLSKTKKKRWHWNTCSFGGEMVPPPPAGTLKINFDTAIRDSFSAQAAVCRNFEGCILKAVALISPPCDPSTGEALAALLAAQPTLSFRLKSFIL